MESAKGIAQVALASVMALSMLSVASNAKAETATTSYVKCYGIAASGKNDCATGAAACSATIKVDRACYAYIETPKGLCEKIAGSSVNQPAATCMLPNGKPANAPKK